MRTLALGVLFIVIAAAVPGAAQEQGGLTAARRDFRARRAVVRYTQTIEAAPDRVFPLLCPIREAEWADNWVGWVVYAVSGVAEADGVYATERGEGEKDDTIWVVTRHDARNHEIEMVYFIPGVRVTKLLMVVRPLGDAKSSVAVTYTSTGLSERGNAEIAANFEDKAVFEGRMADWQSAMNYYLKTGRLLKHPR